LGRSPVEQPSVCPPDPTVDVGWLLDTDRAQFIWEAPRPVGETARPGSIRVREDTRDHESRLFEVPCPVDVQLRFSWDEKGGPTLTSVDADRAAIRTKHLNQMVTLVGRREWRHPERPILQFITPYVFVSDAPVVMTQIPPVGAWLPKPWPGLLIGGRLPIHIWPRQMMWAFEWRDTTKDLFLRRGDPWFYVRFETEDPATPVRMIEAELTPALRGHIQGLTAVSNYVDQTFSLFKVAEARRPAHLLTPKLRHT
jgi:hypothetical protein